MRWLLTVYCVLGFRSTKNPSGQAPLEERGPPNRRHAIPSTVRIGPCPARLEETHHQGSRRRWLRGEDGTNRRGSRAT